MSARGHIKRLSELGGTDAAKKQGNVRTQQQQQILTAIQGRVTAVDFDAGTVTVQLVNQKSVTVNQGRRWLDVGDATWVYGKRAN